MATEKQVREIKRIPTNEDVAETISDFVAEKGKDHFTELTEQEANNLLRMIQEKGDNGSG